MKRKVCGNSQSWNNRVYIPAFACRADESRRILRHGQLWFGQQSKQPPSGNKSRKLPRHRTARCLHVVFVDPLVVGDACGVLLQGSCKNLTSGQTSWLMFLGKVLTICWRILKEWTVEQVTVSSHTLCSSQFTIV